MQAPKIDARVLFGTFFVFALIFVGSLFVFPLLVIVGHEIAPSFYEAIPYQISNLLFLWPQLLLIPGGVQKGQTYIGHGTLGYFAAAFWLIAAVVYAALTSRLRWLARVALIFPYIIVIGLIAHVSLSAAGFRVMLDGF
jgi:hypothetical protein